jgi:Domain of unknown function (DUF4352)
MVTSDEKTTFYNTPGPVSAPPGTFFIFISVTMFNNSSSSITVAATDFSLVDSSGGRYRPQALANSFYGAFPFQGKELQPGCAVSGKVLYLVPDSSSGLEIQTTLDGYILGWKLLY